MTRTTPDPQAPHVEPGWVDAFVVELRLLDVPGDRIGDALAEVESHCADAGEAAAEAFGDPVAYARSLELPGLAGATADSRRVVGAVAVQVAGLLLLPNAVAALARGDEVRVTAGALLAAVLVLAATGALALAPGRAVRLVLNRPVVTVAGLALVTVVVTLPAALWRATAVDLPAGAVAGAGVAALVVGTALGWRTLRDTDPVRGPESTGAAVPGATRVLTVAPLLLVPAATALLTLAFGLAAR